MHSFSLQRCLCCTFSVWALLVASCSILPAQSWFPLGSGVNGTVYAITGYNGNIYAGGTFDTAGGIAANNIAEWNGSEWKALGTGVNGTVYSMTEWNGFLCVGGQFDSAGGQLANNIAVWNGNTWLSLGNGLYGGVSSLANWNGSLYAIASTFTITGSFLGEGAISEWNDSSWVGLPEILDTGLSYAPLLIANNNLCSLGGGTGIDQYNGTNLSYIPSFQGRGSEFKDLLVSNVEIGVYNGKFIEIQDYEDMGATFELFVVAELNDTGWCEIYSNSDQYLCPCVYAEVVQCGDILYMGSFRTGASIIQSWDGSSWTIPGGGLSYQGFNWVGAVNALYTDSGNIYVGGVFDHAGAMPVNNIAGLANATAIHNVATDNPITISPNPSTGLFQLKMSNPSESTEIQVYNLLGEKVYQSTITQINTTLNLTNLAQGVYLYRVISESGQAPVGSGKLVIAK